MDPLLFVASNIIFWLGLIGVQYGEFRMGRIPHKRSWSRTCPKEYFLYLEDWNTGSWGDVVGLSCMAYAFGAQSEWSWNTLLIAGFIGLLSTLVLHTFWKMGLPNSGYPYSGKLSLSGKLHLLYTWAQTSIALALLIVFWNGALIVPSMVAISVGAIVYGSSFLCDFLQGKFTL
jgi:hypothetical protein